MWPSRHLYWSTGMSADEILALLELLLLGPECDVSLFHHLDLRFTDKPSETGRDIEEKSDVCCDLVLSTRILHLVIKAGTILESVKNHQRRAQKQRSKEQPEQQRCVLTWKRNGAAFFLVVLQLFPSNHMKM